MEARSDIGVNTACVEAAARARGIPFAHRAIPVVTAAGPVVIDGKPFMRRWLVLDTGRHRVMYHESGMLRIARPVAGGGYRVGPHINRQWVPVTIEKPATKRAISDLGGMTPPGRDFGRHEADEALRYAAEIGPPICLKPTYGERGTLVFTGITAPDQVRRKFAAIAARFPRVLVERSVPGATYRFLYLRPAVIAVALQDPPMVTGDGATTLEALIGGLNEASRRRGHPRYGPIAADAAMRAALAEQGLAPDTVLAPGRRAAIVDPAQRTVEDRWIDATDALHPSHRAAVETLCRRMQGLMLAGLDVVIADPAAPAQPGNHWVLEINSSPDLADHHDPWEGTPRDVAGMLVDALLQAGR